MSLNVAAAVAAVPNVPFINWQYVYCYLVSLFGRVCATDPASLPSIEIPTVPDLGITSGTAATSGGGGFWSWLWPFHSSASGVQAAGSASDVAFWASVGAFIPEPIKVVFGAIGTVLGFLWSAFSFLSYTVSTLLFLGLIVALVVLALIRVKEWTDFGTLPKRVSGKSYGWSRWQDLLDATMTTEPKRWRDGIIAADDMLGELLTKLGYFGHSTAEQMRHVPDGAFVTLPQAWEAHRIRNFVVQRNSNFILTQREAFRVMKLYEQVFEEFDFI